MVVVLIACVDLKCIHNVWYQIASRAYLHRCVLRYGVCSVFNDRPRKPSSQVHNGCLSTCSIALFVGQNLNPILRVHGASLSQGPKKLEKLVKLCVYQCELCYVIDFAEKYPASKSA